MFLMNIVTLVSLISLVCVFREFIQFVLIWHNVMVDMDAVEICVMVDMDALRCDLHSSCRLYMCVSAIVLLDLFAGFGNLPVQGKCCRFFLTCLFIFYREDTCLSSHCGSACTASRRHCTDPPQPH